MNNCALVWCRDEELRKPSEKGLKEFIYKMLGRFKRKEIIKEELTNIYMYEDLSILLIELPYTNTELLLQSSAKVEKIKERLKNLCKNNNVSSCIFSLQIPDIYRMADYLPGTFSGKCLYLSLLPQILDVLFAEDAGRIMELNIAILDGGRRDKLSVAMQILAPKAKYITVVSKSREMIDDEIDALYADNGLSTSITSDFRNGMSEADIVIDLCGTGSILKRSRLKSKVLIINVSGNEYERDFICNRNIINGVTTDMGKWHTIFKGKNILDHFSCIQILEIVLSHKIGIEKEVAGNIINAQQASAIAQAFSDDCCSIDTFIGMHVNLEVGNLKGII